MLRGMAGADDSQWTNVSVRRLLEAVDSSDPASVIGRKAQTVALDAMEAGWIGPPFDPFELAAYMGVTVVARQNVEDARLTVTDDVRRIEFNPSRQMSRIRFSVAHELAHLLFDDVAEQVRERHAPDPTVDDTWQLEMLCNVGASEFLMPAGAFPQERVEDLSLNHLLDLRAQFGVSTEAVLRRAVRLTEQPAAMFVATRHARDSASIDYVTSSRSWTSPVRSGFHAPADSVLGRVTAVGFTRDGTEQWNGHDVHVQAVGVPPYGGHRYPRVIGLITPVASADRSFGAGIRYVRGDATQPEAKPGDILAHVVPAKVRGWGGRGFAASLRSQRRDVHDQFASWAASTGTQLRTVHWAQAADGLQVASMVAQAGFGSDQKARLSLGALHRCLLTVGDRVSVSGGTVHMPLIGTGYGGVRWPVVRDLVLDDLCARGVAVTVYVRPDAVMPGEADAQLSLLS